jgi:hypothetical protein
VSDVDRLILVPMLLAAGYFLYRYIRNAVRGEAGCHGDCAKCSQELMRRVHDGLPANKGK